MECLLIEAWRTSVVVMTRESTALRRANDHVALVAGAGRSAAVSCLQCLVSWDPLETVCMSRQPAGRPSSQPSQLFGFYTVGRISRSALKGRQHYVLQQYTLTTRSFEGHTILGSGLSGRIILLCRRSAQYVSFCHELRSFCARQMTTL